MHAEPKMHEKPAIAAFVPVNELEQLLMAATTDASARTGFYRALLEHQLYIIDENPQGKSPGRQVLQAGTEVKVRKIEIDGCLHTPIFTSVERIEAVITEKGGYLSASGRDFLALFRGSDVVLNPGAAYGKVLLKDEIEAMLNGSIFEPRCAKKTLPANAQIFLGQPKSYPHQLVEGLRKRFAEMQEVKAAYLAQAFIPNVASSHIMIGIDSKGPWEPVLAEAVAVARSILGAGEYVDFVRIECKANDTVDRYMQNETTPFYQRRKKWLGIV